MVDIPLILRLSFARRPTERLIQHSLQASPSALRPRCRRGPARKTAAPASFLRVLTQPGVVRRAATQAHMSGVARIRIRSRRTDRRRLQPTRPLCLFVVVRGAVRLLGWRRLRVEARILSVERLGGGCVCGMRARGYRGIARVASLLPRGYWDWGVVWYCAAHRRF